VTWIDGTGYVVSPLDGVNGVRRNLLARIMTLVGAIMAPRWTYIEPSFAFKIAGRRDLERCNEQPIATS